MEWKYQRRLVFMASSQWMGWFCERCCWSRQFSQDKKEVAELSRNIEALFNAHDCKRFAAENWKSAEAK